MKSLLSAEERRFASVISQLIHCNHFLPERIELEKAALGDAFRPHQAAWNLDAQSGGEHPNVARLNQIAEALMHSIRSRLDSHRANRVSPDERALCEDLVAYVMYRRCRGPFCDLLNTTAKPLHQRQATFYDRFEQDMRNALKPLRQNPIPSEEVALGFALLFQVERAFYNIFSCLIGTSPALARLRAAVWQSIFTHDMRRYRRGLVDRLGELTTLITGPSGTGKELVAQAIARSTFIPFDPRKRAFVQDPSELFLPLNLSALAENLIESELFGHRKGAFTGAHEDHVGWLESCPPRSSLFLDEIGETRQAVQVKLLRVLQSRTLQRLGESRERRFRGKIIAATNRDLSREVCEGRFREDFYYRLCSDVIATPLLRDQLREAPDDLPRWVGFIAQQICAPDEAHSLTSEVVDWIGRRLPPDYAWPGNFRELEQCVRNILVRGEYRPISTAPHGSSTAFTGPAAAGRLTAAELLQRYCAWVYQQTGSLEQTARRLDLDRRTVRSKLGLAPADKEDVRS